MKPTATIALTDEQRQVVLAQPGEPVHVVDPESNESYVLVRTALYEQLRTLLNDEVVYTDAETLDQVMAEDDANDPGLANLQSKYGVTP